MNTAYGNLLARLQSVRSLGVSFGLDRIRLALERLGFPERRFRAVQIAGTNGKGSTAAFLESILRAAGMRTGLFTSPHLCRFSERIRVDGRELEGERLGHLDEAVAATGVPLTYFEISAVLAFLAFAEAGVEVAVLETGLGGRLDATTASHPLACAITGIALDHQDLLGETLRQIAHEKACIARPGVPLFLGPLSGEARDEVERIAAATGSPLRRFDVDFQRPAFPLGLAGAHQASNAALAVALAHEVMSHAGRVLPSEVVKRGLAETRWPGRLERVADDVLLDCAHNAEGAARLAEALPAAPCRALVVSIVQGKDAAGMLASLCPHFVIATRSSSERSLDPEALAALVPVDQRSMVEVVVDPTQALTRARHLVTGPPQGLTVAAGSIFLVGALRARLLDEPVDAIPGSDPMPCPTLTK
jgi:dihydrofolate synthase/folylpolyglutamate synthase